MWTFYYDDDIFLWKLLFYLFIDPLNVIFILSCFDYEFFKAYITLPKAESDLFIYFASSILSAVFSPSLSLSLPAKSTKLNLDMTF